MIIINEQEISVVIDQEDDFSVIVETMSDGVSVSFEIFSNQFSIQFQ